MTNVLGLLLCIVFVSAQDSPRPAQIPILSYSNTQNPDGSYSFGYETGNGINVQEEGFLKNPGQKDLEAQTAKGTYSYTAPDGRLIQVTWYADETGFHADGAHLPGNKVTTTPRPDAIFTPVAPVVVSAPIFPRGK